MVNGSPNSLVKKSCVGILHIFTHIPTHPLFSRYLDKKIIHTIRRLVIRASSFSFSFSFSFKTFFKAVKFCANEKFSHEEPQVKFKNLVKQ